MTASLGFFSAFSRSKTLSVAAIALALGAALATAKEKDGKHLDRMVSHMEKELALSKDQSAKIRAILAKDSGDLPQRGGWKKHHGCKDCHMSEAGGHGPGGHGQGPMAGDGFIEQLRAPSVDTAALNRTFAARAESMQVEMRARHARRVATFAEIHAVLTPEQRAKAATEMEARKSKMEEKRKKK